MGVGCCLQEQIGGRWSVVKATQHLSCLEIKASILALKLFLGEIIQSPPRDLGLHPPHHIFLEMDNTTAVAYVNRRGNSVAYPVPTSLLLLRRGSWLTALHLPGVLNVEADVASSPEWMLRKDMFRDITHHFYLPEIDHFASRLNHQVPLFVSWLPDTRAAAVDAFQLD